MLLVLISILPSLFLLQCPASYLSLRLSSSFPFQNYKPSYLFANFLLPSLPPLPKQREERPVIVRAARKVAEAKQKWLVGLVLVKFAQNLWTRKESIVAAKTLAEERHKAATFLQKTFVATRQKRMMFKYMDFNIRVHKNKWIFRMAVRNWRKKKAMKVMRVFLRESQNVNEMSIMVSRFLIKVRRVQRFFRSFLRSHHTRMAMIEEVWDDVESKYSMKLGVRMKEARKMRKLVLPKKGSEIDTRSVKDFNHTCELWSIMDKKMEALLSSERAKKHLPGNALHSFGLKNISRADKRDAISRVIMEKRRLHVQNIEEMLDRLMQERKKRAKAKNTVQDAHAILGLGSVGGDSVMKIPQESRLVENDVPLFLFWSSFGNQGGIHKFVEEEFQRTYSRLYGDPVQNWKDQMDKRDEARFSREGGSRGGDGFKVGGSGSNKKARRYGVSVEVFESSILEIGGVDSSAVHPEMEGATPHEKNENRRNTEIVVSTIKKKRHGAEVENMKARAKVKDIRQTRHKKYGADVQGAIKE